MKTTIKLTTSTSLTVLPCTSGGVLFEITPEPTQPGYLAFVLSQDQCGALLFAIEQAAEAARIKNERVNQAA